MRNIYLLLDTGEGRIPTNRLIDALTMVRIE
jgi:hypothetical protein